MSENTGVLSKFSLLDSKVFCESIQLDPERGGGETAQERSLTKHIDQMNLAANCSSYSTLVVTIYGVRSGLTACSLIMLRIASRTCLEQR